MKLIPFNGFSNSYLLILDDGSALLFDCAVSFKAVESALAKEGATLKAIFLTHGHYDHIARLGDEGYEGIPVYMGSEDIPFLTDPRLNLSDGMFYPPLSLDSIEPIALSDGQEISMGTKILAIATPYHTGGSYCFYLPELGMLFSGDSLFRLSVGRSDLPGACPRLMRSSLAKLKALPDETIVYPGHEKKTTIGFEKTYNEFLG